VRATAEDNAPVKEPAVAVNVLAVVIVEEVGDEFKEESESVECSSDN
jgi:hypothetical protein